MVEVNRGEIVVFGSGPAGLSSARHLNELGFQVTLITPETNVVPRSIYTTRRLWPQLVDEFVGTNRKTVTNLRILTDQGTDYLINAGSDYLMVDNTKVIQQNEYKLAGSGVHLNKLPIRVINSSVVREDPKSVRVYLDGVETVFDYAVDATGTSAFVSKQVEPKRRDENYLAEYVYGKSFLGQLENDEMILLFGPRGYTCWICPSIEAGFIDIVLSGWGPSNNFRNKFLPMARWGFEELIKRAECIKGLTFDASKRGDVYCGVIRSQPTSEPKSKRVFAVGEAAGMAKPGTGQSYDRALKAGDLVADIIQGGYSPQQYYKTWRSLWPDDLFFAGTLARLPTQKLGSVGGMADRVGEWIKKEGEHKAQADLEAFILRDALSLRLFFKFAADPFMRQQFSTVLWKLYDLKVKNVLETDLKWSFPD